MKIRPLLQEEASLLTEAFKSTSHSRTYVQMVLLALLAVPGVAMANGPGVDEMFAAFSKSAIAIFNLMMKLSILLGILIAGKAVFSFKDYSESGGRTSFKTPVILTAVAVFLFTIPTTMNMLTNTLALGGFSGTTIMSEGIPNGGGMPGASAAIRGVLLFVKLVGIIAAIRGFLMFKKVGEGGGNASAGAALTHVLGGAAAVNIEATYNILKNSVGWS